MKKIEKQSSKDCSSGSLDKLSFGKLVDASNKSAECLAEAQKVYKTKFTDMQITVGSVDLFTGNYATVTPATIKYILNNFGQYVHEIIVEFVEMSEVEGEEIVQLIEKICPTTLKFLGLSGCKGNILDGIKSVFNEVKILQFSSDEKEKLEIGKNWQIQALFPNIQQLFLDYPKRPDWVLFNEKYQALKSFALVFSIEMTLKMLSISSETMTKLRTLL